MHIDILVVMPLVALLFGILILIGLTGLFPHFLTPQSPHRRSLS